jgi:hypothetical protein
VRSIVAALAAPYSIRLARAWWSACDVAIAGVLRAQRAGYYGIALLPARVDPELTPSPQKPGTGGAGPCTEQVWA